MNIGQQIKEARETQGLSRAQMAAAFEAVRLRDENGKQISMTTTALWRIENGQRFPSLGSMRALAEVLGVHFIVTGDGVEVAEPVGEE